MLRLRSLVVVGVLAGIMVFGATVALGSWWWNSRIDIQGSELRTVWEVPDHVGDDLAYYYNADFVVKVPKKASAQVIELGSNETVKIKKSRELSCKNGNIEVRVNGTINVAPGASGTQGKITLVVNGVTVSEKVGALGKRIRQDIQIPGSC